MLTINIHQAKTQLSRLVDQAANGEAFVIAKAGSPMVKVLPLQAEERPGMGRLGFMQGEFTVPDDFDQLGSAEIGILLDPQ